jgi:UDP-glucose 4-epimerase
MKIMVTGGAGFIGSHLVDKLLDLGHTVISVDNESSSEHERFFWNPLAENYKIDITDYKKFLPLCNNVDVVFHLAANARIQQTIKDPAAAAKNNVLSTINVLEAAREKGIKRVVFSSTSSSYKESKWSLSENKKLDCRTPYSSSKVFGETLLRSYSQMYGVECVSLRYFNVYGDRQPTAGEYATVIGIFLNQAAKNTELSVVGNGKQKRDFTHVSDIVDATIRAGLELSSKKANGAIYNLGYGKAYPVLKIAKKISEKITFVPDRPGEHKKRLSNCKKAKKDLGWTPKISLDQWLKIECMI